MGRRQTLTDQDILARARPVFLRQGIHASTRAIAEAVGLTWGALAFRFGSKLGLFERVMADGENAAESIGGMAERMATHRLAASLMRQAVRAVASDIDSRLRAHGLTLAQRRALAVLGEGHRFAPTDVSRALDLDAGGATRLLDRLLAKQLCVGFRCDVDRRSVLLEITSLGRARLEATEGIDAAILRDWFASAQESEMQTLCNLLSKLLASRR
ncbi:MAG: TetR family transcriptional regulator [Paucibacter sp.]|nr:TetR family transcriptional regulator [Roseateles sp.]